MFRTDLHIHSRFSRATSSRLTVPHLAAWAGIKGIDVLATGDFTHPAWRQELCDALVLDETTGLYRLKHALSREDMAREAPAFAGMHFQSPQFMLEAEISSIYKKNGKVRKIHNLVYVPDFESANRLCEKLDAIGNLKSDGRPILGLDARNLLEMVLEIPRAFMIPAHIWTPWFALFGSKSGFDSLEECFEDLTPHIFAAETGLSSDPDMNRCWSHLDHLTMVSSSDAHSGENLAREATTFDGPVSYDGIFAALHHGESDTRCTGTLEFFPEEGKYHLDGHRACGVVLEPGESVARGDICPVCGKPVTVGVLHRVLALADRKAPPEPGKGFRSLIPLPEIIGELLRCGSKSGKVQERCSKLMEQFGPEMGILQDVPEKDVGHVWPELGEALFRMRSGKVIRKAGYDGEYGVIRLFGESETRPSLLERTPIACREPIPKKFRIEEHPIRSPACAANAPPTNMFSETFTPAQQAAMDTGPGPVLVLAGPGAGKTRTLIGRMVKLVRSGVPASEIAAVTFTRRAAEEMRERLASALGSDIPLPETDTLHALALKHWQGEKTPVILSEEAARKAFAAANPTLDTREAAHLFTRLEMARELLDVPGDLSSPAGSYARWKKERNLADYTDLPEAWLAKLRAENCAAPRIWKHLLVDEVQDLSPLQKELLGALVPADGSGFFGIGDPDQSIYSFRGADADIEQSLRARWPHLKVLGLTESYRSSASVLSAGIEALAGHGSCGPLTSATGTRATLQWMNAPNAEREASWIADRVFSLMGGTSHQQADLHSAIHGCHLEPGSCSPGDIAVLCRVKALMPPIKRALEHRGIPCATPETEPFWNDAQADILLQAAARRTQHMENERREAILTRNFPLLAAMEAPPAAASPSDPLDNVPEPVWLEGPRAVFAKSSAFFDPLFGESTAFKKLCAAWEKYGGWKGLLDFVAFRRDLDMVQGKAEVVQIMTLHASKGLEFKAVFIPGAEDGILPFRGMDALLGKISNFVPPAVEEERRLLYVGITRASEAVFLSSAARRVLYGHALELAHSPLLPLKHFQALHMERQIKKTANQLTLL